MSTDAKLKDGPPVKAKPGVLDPDLGIEPPPPPQIILPSNRDLPRDPNAENETTDPRKKVPDPNSMWEILHGAVGPFVKGEIWPAGKFPRYTDFEWLLSQKAIRRLS